MDTPEWLFWRAQSAWAPAKAGWLEVTHRTGIARFELGKAAEKWALRIRYPRSRIDKLGVKPGSRVAVIGLDDREFEKEIRSRTADVAAKAKPESDLIFVSCAAAYESPR